MEIPEHIKPFWEAFLASSGERSSARFTEASHFDDNQESADALADLVLKGIKGATASLLWHYEITNEPLPRVGDLSVVTNWAGDPLCVIELTKVDITPYEDVDEQFAADEGEGDGSLRYWREVHWAFFSRECARLGRTPSLQMPVVCVRFKVVYTGSEHA